MICQSYNIIIRIKFNLNPSCPSVLLTFWKYKISQNASRLIDPVCSQRIIICTGTSGTGRFGPLDTQTVKLKQTSAQGYGSAIATEHIIIPFLKINIGQVSILSKSRLFSYGFLGWCFVIYRCSLNVSWLFFSDMCKMLHTMFLGQACNRPGESWCLPRDWVQLHTC